VLRPRLIASLLLDNSGLVKTRRFAEPKYVGDVLNAVRIFNEKKTDELMLMDIGATRDGRSPDLSLIQNVASEVRMPLCYGGGVKSVDQVLKIISLGVEKVSINSAALETPSVLSDAAKLIGSQSVVATIDIKKVGLRRRYEVVTQNGTKKTGKDPLELIRQYIDAGAGEIVVNNVDLDGMMLGYDLEYLSEVAEISAAPISFLGGAGSLEHIKDLVTRFGAVGAAAGSLFVFKGKFRAVLINYPTIEERDQLARSVGL